MSSTISAGTTSGTAIAISGDTSGQLVLQTNGTTTAVTISTGQVVTLAQPLPVASGGSGVTTSTGTGAVVLGTSPVLTTPTISSLSSASATTLTLQSAGITGLTIDTSQNIAFNSGYGSVARAYGCRAWGVATWSAGVPTLAASGGVSSITDLGTGNMQWNLSITLPDTNYSVFGSVGTDCIWCRVSKNSKTTTDVSFGFANPGNTAEVDPTTPVSMSIFR